MTEGRTRYDVVPYPGKSYSYAHPDRLHVQARLFGLRPAPVESCRVLELGCGDGSNLIPMASRLPGSTFTGIDLAREVVAAARARAAEAGLSNARFDAVDIAEFPEREGEYDYIVSHGVWSWVADNVREAMLALCRRHLAPQGVAYISYNTYPGWHLHRVTRDLMRIHGERFEDPLEQVEQGQTLVRFVAKALEGSGSAYAKVIEEELKLFRYFDPKYFYHDFLSPENRPVLFRDFVARARSHHLQYLGDSTLGEMLTSGFPAEIATALSRLAGDVATMGQYLDLVRGTGFRRTLLCHEGIDLKRELSGEDLHGVRIAILGEITAETDLKSGAPVTWRSGDGTEVHVTGAIGKAAMLRLAASAPEEIEFDDLRDRARELLGAPRDDADEIKALGGVVLHAHGVGLLDLSPRDRGLFGRITDRPVADPLIRMDAARKLPMTTNRRHEAVALGPFDHEIVPLLDGAHDHGAIRAAVRAAIQAGRLTVTTEGSPSQEAGVIAEAVDENVAKRLEQLRASAFLVG